MRRLQGKFKSTKRSWSRKRKTGKKSTFHWLWKCDYCAFETSKLRNESAIMAFNSINPPPFHNSPKTSTVKPVYIISSQNRLIMKHNKTSFDLEIAAIHRRSTKPCPINHCSSLIEEKIMWSVCISFFNNLFAVCLHLDSLDEKCRMRGRLRLGAYFVHIEFALEFKLSIFCQ